MSIATGKGDGGTTRLTDGREVSKADPRVDAYGTVDELGSHLGLVRSFCDDLDLADRIERIQRELFLVAGELATTPSERRRLGARLAQDQVDRLDAEITEIETLPGILDDWALPGATRVGAFLDVARTVCRRAERLTVALFDAGVEDHALLLTYLNRLGDLLWLYARLYEVRHGADGALRPDRRGFR